jgi:pyruvate/2-oxoglutarate dehydrogenase complex dihydrolipoamide acyltransferase (E2) component
MSGFDSVKSARSILAAGLLAVGTCLAGSSGSALAQAWDWGGGEQKVASSGKEIGPFDPSIKPGQIIVSFSDRLVYFVTRPGEAVSYPIAIPREQDDWQGVMRISDKRVNPSWTPTPTMIRENPRLPSWVPGGHPMNPLGVRALYLGSSAYRIHGTDAPWTIGTPVSKGCIRMYNQDVIDLYDRVKLGAKVTVTWDSYLEGTRRTVAHSQGGSTIRTDSIQASHRPPVGYAQYSPAPVERPMGKRKGARPVAASAPDNSSNDHGANTPHAKRAAAKAKSTAAFDADGTGVSDRRSRAKDSAQEKASEKAKPAKSTSATRRKKQQDQKEPTADDRSERPEKRAHVDLGAIFR